MAHKTPSIRARRTIARRKRSEAKTWMRDRLLDLLVQGQSHDEIARQFGLNVASVRRQIDKALEARPVETPHLYVALQTARLQRAVRIVDNAMEAGDLKAIEPLLKTLAALDRYHGVALRLEHAQPGDAGHMALRAPERRLSIAAKRAQSDTQALEIACPITDISDD